MTQSAGHRVAVYTGVFDPVHLGHLDIIQRGSRIFDHLIVGVGINPDKSPFFSPDERILLLESVVRPYANVEVRRFNGLAVKFVREVNAHLMLRGLRTTSDMEYEFNMSLSNVALDPDIETVFLMAHEAYSHISGTLLRQIATFGGQLDKFVPPQVKTALEQRVHERQRHQPALLPREILER